MATKLCRTFQRCRCKGRERVLQFCTHRAPRFFSYSSPAECRSAVDQSEAHKFSYTDWWDPGGTAGPLHALNTLRVPLIRNAILGIPLDDLIARNHAPCPLQGYTILDVGCGAGILSEALARLGASVMGIDPSQSNVSTARDHALGDPHVFSRLSYECCSVEEIGRREPGRQFDAVVASEVVEHVADLETFIHELTALVKAGGVAVFTTINQTALAYLLVIVAGEWLLQLLPRGSHHWERLVPPHTLASLLRGCGMEVGLPRGMYYNPLTGRWGWSGDIRVNYALTAVKPNSGF